MALLDNDLASQAHQPITKAEAMAALENGGIWGDSVALRLVTQDCLRAEQYEASKAWVASWPTATTLYQSPFSSRFWEGTTSEKSNLPQFTVASAVNSLTPQVVNGLFYENPPFMTQERAGTTAQEARAVGGVLAFQLEDINFKEELRLGVMNALLYGTAIWKWGWESFKRTRKVYRRKPGPSVKNPVPGGPNIRIHNGEIEEEVIEEYVERPTFEHMVNLRYVLVDPTLNVPDITKAKYVIHRQYMTWDQINKLRDRPGYDIPTREQLLELFLPPKEPVEAASAEAGVKNPLWDMRAEARYEEGTIDPFSEPLEVLERWTNDTCIVVLQKKAVLYNGENSYGKIPFLSVGWWDVPEAFFSMGLAKTIGSEQRLQQGIINAVVDTIALNLNLPFIQTRGTNIPTQNIRIAPGKLLVEDTKDGLRPLDRLPGVPEAPQQISMSQARVDQLAGAGALNTSGMAAGHSNLARTAAGANLMAGSATTAPDFVDKLANNVIVPFLYSMQEMNNALLPEENLHYILNDELQDAFIKEGKDVVSLLNAKVKFGILAGAKMQARRNMAQAMPLLFQLVGNQQTMDQLQIANKRVDFLELTHMLFESSEFKTFNDVIVDMTPEEAQKAAMNSPAAKMQIQAKAASDQLQQKHNNQLDIVDAENQARAGREVLRAALEKQEVPEALTGGGGSTGFGAGE